MTNRGVVVALMGALMMVATGCAEECVDQYDCNNNKGSAGVGKAWACRSNKCVAEDVSTPAPTPDSGTPVPDAGTPDAGTGGADDAGTPPPEEMTIPEGGDCRPSGSCMAGLFCEALKCQPLRLAVTERVSGSTATDRAVGVHYKTPGVAGAPSAGGALSPDPTGTSRFPRWNKEGTAV